MAIGQTTATVGLNGVLSIAAGIYDGLAVRSDGTAIGWGYNVDGEVTIPGGLNGVVAVAGGYQFSLALAARPGPPVALSAAIIATNEVDLSWSEYSSGVTGFEIDRAPDAAGSPGSWTQIARWEVTSRPTMIQAWWPTRPTGIERWPITRAAHPRSAR